MADIKKLSGEPITPEPNQHAIEVLEEALEQARAGKFIGVAMALTIPGQGHCELLSGGWIGADAMVGGLNRLAFDILHNRAHSK